MKKVLYSLLIFISIFFVIDKVSALPTGDGMSTSSEKVVLGKFLHGSGGSMNMYAFNGTGNSCGNYQNPDSNAPISCWYDHNLSLTAPSYHSDVNPNSWGMVFYPQISLKKNHVYRVELVGIASNSTTALYFSEDKIKSVKNANLISSQTSVSGFEITYTIVFSMNSDMTNEIQLDMSKTDINLRDFDDAWGYMFMPKIEDITSEVFGFKEVAPVFNSSYTATQLNDFLNNNSPTLTYGNSTFDYMVNTFIPNEVYKEYGEYYLCLGSGTAYRSYCFISDDIEAFSIYDFGSSFFRFDIDTSVSSVYAYSINNGGKESSNSDWYTSSHYSKNFLSYQLSHTGEYLKTNLPYVKYSGFSGNNTFKTADGYMFNPGDIFLYKGGTDFVVNTDYKTSLTPESYIFNEEIDDIDYSKMIFEFDVDIFKERGNIFDYLVEFHTLGTIQEDMTLNESHKQKFSRPYIEYVDENGVSRRLEIDFGYDEENELRNYWYVGNQDEISGSIQSLKLIIPMDKTAYARYSIELISFIPFTTYYVTNDEALSYYSNVDLTNKYGVVFMPKLIENNSDISSIFYTTGIESVLVYSSYDYKEQPVEIYDSNLSEFNYIISYENINYNLVFKVNSLTPNLGIVTYDTRYYTYKIIDSKYSLGNIINPNTGENHYVDFSNTSNVKMDFDDIGDVFYFISEKIDSSGESYLLFKDSVSTFFNTMPTDIYILILTVLAVILIGTALALGGWK